VPDYDVAFSFAGEQREYVQQVANELRADGIHVFYDVFEQVDLWGKDLYEHLDYVYRKAARFCVVFVSADYARKVWPTHERRSAQAHALIEGEEYLLPARFDDTDLPGLRPTIGYIDVRDMDPLTFATLLKQKVRPDFWQAWQRSSDRRRNPATLSDGDKADAFPFSMDDLPHPFVASDGPDSLIVCGPSRYDLNAADDKFTQANNPGSLLPAMVDDELPNRVLPPGFRSQRRWSLTLGDSTLNLSAAAEIVAAIAQQSALSGARSTPARRYIIPYHETDEAVLSSSNLVMMPCGDVNPLLPTGLAMFELAFNILCPVHHQPYETSEAIKSEVSGTVYEKGIQAGFVVLLPNPWNHSKAMLVCGGNTGLGTQAALLRTSKAFSQTHPFGPKDH
jgi:hypothetical protein